MAKGTGFIDDQLGISLGAGIYYHPLANDNRYDPIPSLVLEGTEAVGSNNLKLLPIKLGLFKTSGRSEVEGYFRYMLNKQHSWTTTGDLTGEGKTTFRSYGFGAHLGVSMWTHNRAQVNLVINGEYVIQRALLYFNDSNETQKLQLNANSMLAGLGVQPELWLGDMWVLSLFAGYQYGFLRNWKVTKAASFMGAIRDVGDLTDSEGRLAHTQFGGLLIELSLKLNFHM